MTNKPNPEEFEEIDPYELLKSQHLANEKRIEELELRQNNIEEMWNRILNIAHEPQLAPRQPQYQQQYQQPYYEPLQPQYVPPQQQYIPPQQPTPVPEDAPVWEKEKLQIKNLDESQTKKPAKRSKRLMLIGGIIIILVVVWLYMSSQGWSCAMPGGAG